MNDTEIKIILNRKIQAPVEKVYAAWTDAAMMKQWFAPEDMTIPSAESDPRVGGSYTVCMHDPESGSNHIVSGEYEELIPNERIRFNWMWKDGVDRTQVTIELQPDGDNQTLLTLTHRGFSQQEFADKHNEGWESCLDSLENHL